MESNNTSLKIVKTLTVPWILACAISIFTTGTVQFVSAIVGIGLLIICVTATIVYLIQSKKKS